MLSARERRIAAAGLIAGRVHAPKKRLNISAKTAFGNQELYVIRFERAKVPREIAEGYRGVKSSHGGEEFSGRG